MSGADQNAERGADRLSADTGMERGDGIASGVSTARTGVAAFVYERDVLRVTGADAVTFVQGQVSADVAALGRRTDHPLRETLAELGQKATHSSAPFADNTTAAAIRWLGP